MKVHVFYDICFDGHKLSRSVRTLGTAEFRLLSIRANWTTFSHLNTVHTNDIMGAFAKVGQKSQIVADATFTYSIFGGFSWLYN